MAEDIVIPETCKHGVSLKKHCCQCNVEVWQGFLDYKRQRDRERSTARGDGNGMDVDEEG
jgi:hypothetical protein